METISSEKIMSTLREELAQINATVDRQEASVVTEVADGIARISGLKSAMAGELLKLTSSTTGLDVYGLVQNLDQDDVGAVLFGDAEEIKEGDECRTTGRVMDIPVGHAMLGRVVNPLGQPIDGLGPINATHRRPIEFKAPGIMDRQPVCEPVQTGLLAIDAMVPIGRGQRELIIGDRKTGKTAIAIDAIVNQRETDMLCIYVAIGQKASTVAAIRESLSQHGVLDKTVIVAATAAESALRLHRFLEPSQEPVPAVLAYTGIVFRYLHPETFTAADFSYAQRHLFITSFLYGLLRPLDGIRPYRLEGNVRLPDADGPTRFAYWQPRLTDLLIKAVQADDGVLVNLASAEMKRLFDWRRVCASVRVVTPEFRVMDGGRLRSVVVYAKMCRGAMARFILQQRLTDVAGLSAFNPSPDDAVGQLPVVVGGLDGRAVSPGR